MKQFIQKVGMMVGLLLSVLPAYAYDFEVDGIYYNITSMSDLEVGVTYRAKETSRNTSHYRNSSYTGEISIPSTVNYNNRTFTVTSIEEAAFGSYDPYEYSTYYENRGCEITKIYLPNTINKIRPKAFKNCRLLKEITIPEGVRYIGSLAFFDSNITSITIPNEVNIIGTKCFSSTPINIAVIGLGVTNIEDEAFSDCSKLLEVFFTSPDKPTIASDAFNGCHSALEKYVPSTAIYGFGKEYITFPNNSFQYSGKSHDIEWSNNLRAYNCSIEDSECKTEVNAGSYNKKLTATYSNGIDISVTIPFDYTINKAPLNLTVNDTQREYGNPNPTFSCSITGFVNNENEVTIGATPFYECEANQNSKVGAYRILASLDAPNYDITYKYGTLSVLKAPLSIRVINSTKLYGDINPDIMLSYVGLKNDELAPDWVSEPTIITESSKSSNAGAYPVYVSGGQAKNYDIISYTPGTLTINKRELFAKADDCERFYGEKNPDFNISYIGFVNNDTKSSLISLPLAECSASENSNVGKYPISVSGGESENYSFIYQEGQLTVNPLSVGFDEIYNSVDYGDMSQSTTSNYFNYIPKISGPFSPDDFWIELWFLDKDNRYDQHIATIAKGEYAGNYCNTNVDRIMNAGKYILNLTSKGTNPNVVGNPSRAYVTVNRASSRLDWESDSPITIGVGEKIDLGISYVNSNWCDFNTDYDRDIIELSNESELLTPHWYVTGLKEGETNLTFSIECMKNEMGYYDLYDSKTISKTIKVESKDNAVDLVTYDTPAEYFVYNLQGILVLRTEDKELLGQLPSGLYIINGKKTLIR